MTEWGLAIIVLSVLGWLDLLVRGCHTRLATASMMLMPIGLWVALYNILAYPFFRVTSTSGVVLICLMIGVGVGASLANMHHGHWGFRGHGWVALALWSLLINILFIGSVGELIHRSDWSPNWYGLVLLMNVFALIHAVHVSVVSKRMYEARMNDMRGLCPQCGYDLHGNPSVASCSECGHQQKRSPARG